MYMSVSSRVSFNHKILSKAFFARETLYLKRFRESLLAWEGAFPRNRKVGRRIRPFGGRVPFSRKDLRFSVARASCFRRNEEERKKRERVVEEEEEEEEGVVYDGSRFVNWRACPRALRVMIRERRP